MDREFKINARRLSNPGPRLLVENALAKGTYSSIRVIVSNIEAAKDLESLFISKQAKVSIDQIADEYHILAYFPDAAKKSKDQ